MLLQVARCATLGESVKHQKGIKQNKGPNVEESQAKLNPINEKRKEENLDPEFKEFLEVHSKKPSEKNIWSNDAVDGEYKNPIDKDYEDDDEQEEKVEPSSEDKVAHKKSLSDLDVCIPSLQSFFINAIKICSI